MYFKLDLLKKLPVVYHFIYLFHLFLISTLSISGSWWQGVFRLSNFYLNKKPLK